MTCQACEEIITRREQKLNGGLCDSCFRLAAAAIAREIAADLHLKQGYEPKGFTAEEQE